MLFVGRPRIYSVGPPQLQNRRSTIADKRLYSFFYFLNQRTPRILPVPDFIPPAILLLCNLGHPLEEFIKGVVATMRTIPSQAEIHALAGVPEFDGKIDGYGESGITVQCTMTDVPVRSYRRIGIVYKIHGVHQIHVPPDVIADGRTILLRRKIGEVHAIAGFITKLLILSAGSIDALYPAVKGRDVLQGLGRYDIVQVSLDIKVDDVFTALLTSRSAPVRV